jgi:hypothetical protein
MPRQHHHIPLDDPNLEHYQNAHAIDHDIGTTNLAISLARDAWKAGYPDDPEAGPKTLTGPAGGAVVNAVMVPSVETAVAEDEEAEEHSTVALQAAQDAKAAADTRSDLPNHKVQLADGTSRTRGEIQTGHDVRAVATAQRVSRGDLEHQEQPPGPGLRFLVVPVLALIEMFLLLWPVTNASWSDPKSVAYFTGLAVIFIAMNEKLPELAGKAIRSHREAKHAAVELTAVGVTTSRDGHTVAGRAITGHADEGFVRRTRHRMLWCCVLVGTVIAIYAGVMATRVVRLAAPLGSLLYAVLAAALITSFTAGALVYLIWRWSRGNALGDEHREHGALLDESRARAEQLKAESHASLAASADASEEAERHLRLGDQAISDGTHAAGRTMQKAAKILGLESLHMPAPENIVAVGRPVRERVISNLDRAAAIRAEVVKILEGPHPFAPAVPAPNPWELRTQPRRGLPNPAFIDPAQIGPLHAEDDEETDDKPLARYRRPWVLLLLAVLLAVVIVAVILFAHL